MPSATAPPTTARTLLAALQPFRPAVEGEALTFAAGPPADLVSALRVLHSGARALLARRRWYGCDPVTGRVFHLNPAAPIPANVALLAVEGDHRWDRIPAAAPAALPRLFS